MDIRRVCLALVVASTAMTVGAAPSWSSAPTKAARPRVALPARLMVLDNQRRIDVNNVNMFVTNFGSFAWDLSTGNSGLMYPKGTNKTAVFASGLWLGAVDSATSETRVEVAEYSQEYGPGQMVGGTWDDPSRAEYKVYKVARWTGDPEDSAHVERTVDPNDTSVPDPLVHHSWSEYMLGAAPYGAPTRWHHLNPAAPDDSVLGPDVLGDQMTWAVYNDADPGRHTNNSGGTNPLGLEIQQTTFAFNRQGALGNTVFLKFKIINKSVNVLKDMYVSMWSDPDLGGFTDDLVGCDTTLSLGYVYNSTNNDQQYGSAPPTVGYDFFLGPRGESGDTLGLASFNKYINGTDPASFDETYNYMRGFMPDGSDVIDPTTGLPTKFFVSGDPVTGTGWLDTNPADRRFLLSSGPFVMRPGDVQEVVGAIIVGQGKDRLSSIAGLRFFDTFAQDAFDRGFLLPSPPAQPKVDVSVDHGTVTLCWDAASRFNYTQAGYTFEGYNVYQGETVAGPWRLIATHDEVNAVRVIFDEVFDVTTGQLIPQFPVAYGSDAGVSYCHTVTQDAIRGGKLNDASEYFFAVTAYSYGPTERPKVLENAQAVVRVMPQRWASGTDPSTAHVDSFTYSRVDPLKPPSTDVVTATVVNPNLTNGDCYKVTFSPLPSPVTVGTELVTVGWNLLNTTAGDTLLKHQVNKSGDADYQVKDGFQVKVVGQYSPKLQDAAYRNLNTDHRRAIEGVNFGLPFFGGGAGYGWDFFGGTLDPAAMPDSFTTVQIRFDHTATQKAYRFFRLQQADGSAPAIGRAYNYGGFHDCNFQVWDAINDVQLDAAFVEKMVTDAAGTYLPLGSQLASQDSTWDPSDDAIGDREYLFVIRRPYSDTPKLAIAFDGAVADDSQPLMYAMGVKLRGASDVIDDGDAFEFLYANPGSANDVYTFCATDIVRGDVALEKQGLQRIRVVPNPYYMRSRYELSQFQRIVRFINMPETATIKIFNLSGQLVRTLRKTDPTTSVFDWDLQTENRLPVGSGIYIYHVDAGSAGTTFGRLVVFMEKERLNNF
mgnify:CR=1 FL=1